MTRSRTHPRRGRWGRRSATVLLVGLAAITVPAPAGAAGGTTGAMPVTETTAIPSPTPSPVPTPAAAPDTPEPDTREPGTREPGAEIPGTEQPGPATTSTAEPTPVGTVDPGVPAGVPMSSAPAAPPEEAAVPDADRYGTVSRPVIARGAEQRATGYGFPPGASVRVTLEPSGTDLGTSPAAPDGTVSTAFSTAGLAPGAHTVRWTVL